MLALRRSTGPGTEIVVGDLALDFYANSFRVRGGEARGLRRQEARLLARLLIAAPMTVERDTVIADLWPHPADEPSSVDTLLRVIVCGVRRKLAEAGSAVKIVSVRSVGWRIGVPRLTMRFVTHRELVRAGLA